MGVTDRLSRIIGQSGGLLQAHPGIGEWRSTRAVAPEIVAFVHEAAAGKTYLTVEYHGAGETDEDGYTWQGDAYVVCECHPVFGADEDTYSGEAARERMLERLATRMQEVSDGD